MEQETQTRQPMYAFINASAGWLNPHIAGFLRQHVPELVVVDSIDDIPPSATTVFQFCDGWELAQNFAILNTAPRALLNAYPSSDALARKDHLARVVDLWTAKRPDSVLARHVPRTVRLTLDYAEYVDEALAAADDLGLLASLEENEGRPREERQWWILKPALVDCGAGIRLFSTIGELEGWLESVADETDGEDEDEEEDEKEEVVFEEEVEKDGVMTNGTTPRHDDDKKKEDDQKDQLSFSPTLSTPGLDTLDVLVTTATAAAAAATPSRQSPSLRPKKPAYTFKAGGRIPSAQMRAFVAQQYIHRVAPIEGRKWHVRAYAVAVGRLRVHVFRDMLALLASEEYIPPWEEREGTLLRASLTNTALQDADEVEKKQSMRDFWFDGNGVGADEGSEKGPVPADLFPNLGPGWKEKVFDQICVIAGELFRAAAHTMADKFTVLDKCFELFALDFLVDEEGRPWLLECNETPAFYQQGVAGPIALRVMESLICVVMEHMGMAQVGDSKNAVARGRLVEVLNETDKLGKTNITEIEAGW
ncbi:hypothetical protein VTJ04DRAFT_5169 [Mycothermus thermophilus]|uniref:uncharacterized protein n=1 Tax=Humicola insolens TaxID=85995 RepID=UPI0037428C58